MSVRTVYGVLLAVYATLCTLFAILAPFPAGYDERAHYSYAVHLAEQGAVVPSLDDMFLVDPTGRSAWTAERNYLNHPSSYYAILSFPARALEGGAVSPLVLRLVNVSLSVAALALALQIGLRADWPAPARLVFGIMLVTTPTLPVLGGLVTNDNLAWLGGALACAGAYGLLRAGLSGGRLALLTGGVVLASLAKLTAAILAGSFLLTVLITLGEREGRHVLADLRTLLALALCGLALVPYVLFWSAYGSPAPDTLGHAAIVEQRVAEIPGWQDQRYDLPRYASHFFMSLLMFWPPTVPDTLLEVILLAAPLAVLALAILGVVMAWRVPRRRRTAMEALVLCGAMAAAGVMAIHLGFTFVRHLDTGWLKGIYPRYYFPLLPLLAASVAVAVARLQSPAIAAFAGAAVLGYAGFAGWRVVQAFS